MPRPSSFDSIVIGAGAAGFFAAIEAGKTGKRILLIDHSSQIGEKIRISGGGRCNFTNVNASHENYLSENPNFCRSALSQYPPEKFIELVKKHKIKFHEKKLGQLFCDDSSKEIIEMLYAEAELAGVELYNPYSVGKIHYQPDEKYRFKIDHMFESKSLIIATGGLSIPLIGASDFGYRIAKQFGLNVIEPRPALVPFVIKEEAIRNMTGTSFDSITQHKKTKFRENVLFTHKGLSGPAILQISSYWKEGEEITINLCPDLDLLKELQTLKASKDTTKKQKLKNVLKIFEYPENLNNKITRKNIFPDKFIEYLETKFDLEKTLAESSDKELEKITNSINKFSFIPDGTEGYTKAEVTRGGVDTKELDSKTMECKKVPGLFFIGEAVDVTGWLGGYNFQWAWASGYLAGHNC